MSTTREGWICPECKAVNSPDNKLCHNMCVAVVDAIPKPMPGDPVDPPIVDPIWPYPYPTYPTYPTFPYPAWTPGDWTSTSDTTSAH